MRFALLVLGVVPLAAQTAAECETHRRRGQVSEARDCYSKLTRSNDPGLRAEGFWGLGGVDNIKQANEMFKAAAKMRDKDANLRVRWGRLYFERWQPADAAQLFEEALAIDKEHPGALLGLAIVASENFESKAVELAGKALKADPKLVEARELLAQLALEDNNPKKAREEADQALAISNEALDAMAVHLTMELLEDKTGQQWIDRIFKVNPLYGEAYRIAGHFFVLNRRYEEGIKLYRKAIEIDPSLWRARSELGVNLMRLGDEKEAREHLEASWNAGYGSTPTRNTLKLLDKYENFTTRKTPRTILRLHKKEDELLAIYFQAELDRALRTYEKKYKFKLDRPVQLEVYPDHEDFAVRTMGMPGLGALGVTFGYVVAMDSPAARVPGAFHWASTLWHELSHVFVLSATKHRVPRWFTEGMAVHEETAISSDWGDRLGPDQITAMQKKQLLPVAELDRGFIRPSYPSQVIVSYFQAGRICDYINEKWGYDRLLAMMHAFGAGKTTPQVIEQELKLKPEEFDKQFLAWLDAQNKTVVEKFAEWRKRLRGINENAKAKSWDEVITEGRAIRDWFPDYVEAGSVYEFLANAYKEKGDPAAEQRELELYSKAGGRSPAILKRLAKLQENAGQKKEAAATLERLNFIYPKDEELHKRLGDLLLSLGQNESAVREFRAVIAGGSLDVAGGHFQLAQALKAAGKQEDAREHVLLALEAAPGFRAAQKLLLELQSVKK